MNLFILRISWECFSLNNKNRFYKFDDFDLFPCSTSCIQMSLFEKNYQNWHNKLKGYFIIIRERNLKKFDINASKDESKISP